MIRLVGIDVDGTLVGSTGIVDPRVWKAAGSARAAEVHLVLCSGRPAFGLALQYARKLEAGGWHVFQNGASILDLHNGQTQSIPLPLECVQMLIAQARRTGEALELYSDSEYVTENASARSQAHAKILGVPFTARPYESLNGRVVRAQWLLSAEQACRTISSPHPGLEVAQSTSPLMPETRFVGLTREGVSKGSALRTIAMEYGIDLANVMYVGDAGNDLAALKVVGYPVAMGNADPEVLQAARCVVGHVDSGGLAEAIQLALASAPR
jgi:Cof subfamily protein (haloacid dehalogenase superfamily)